LEEGGKEMNIIFLIIIGILLTVDIAMIMYCEYWRENNPWKWFFIKTLTTLLIVTYIMFDAEAFGKIDLVFVSIISACIGIDLTFTLIDSKKKDSYGA
jgi:hypothetical protein